MDYTQEQIVEKYYSLPQDLRTAMASVESAKIIQQIEKKHKLNIAQAGELASETGFVLMGLTRPENFIRNLSERLEVATQKAKEIALDVNAQIFSRVKESLKKLHGIGQESAAPPLPQKEEKPAQQTEPLELIKKHIAEKPSEIPQTVQTPYVSSMPETPNPVKNDASNGAKPNYFEALKQKISAEEIVNPVKSDVSDGIKEPPEITRYAKQTTEIKLPDKESVDTKQKQLKTNEYPKGDPYRESL